MFRKLHIQGFKTADDVSLELGRLNVFVGANGAGKTNLLEAIGLLGCAAAGRVDDEAFKARGVRPGTAALYKTALSQRKRIRRTITISVESEHALYRASIDSPIKEPSAAWKFLSEAMTERRKELATRSPRGGTLTGVSGKEKLKPSQYAGLAPLLRSVRSDGPIISLLDELNEFAIYTPFTPMLRGTTVDPALKQPLGLQGGGLPEAVMRMRIAGPEGPLAAQRLLRETVALVDWADAVRLRFATALPSTVSPSATNTKFVIAFRDKFMTNERNNVSALDASEGALYVLFLLTLVLHPRAPKVAAVDNVDQALNPRLARALVAKVQEVLLDSASDRQLLLTTHNPLVLDALRLQDDRVRLFVVDRARDGATRVKRIAYSEAIAKANANGMTLSRLWLSGMIGGMADV